MKHVVINEIVICPKCLKKHNGSAVAVLDFYSCTDCFYNGYCKELEPIIEKMVRDYFQPDSSKREDYSRIKRLKESGLIGSLNDKEQT